MRAIGRVFGRVTVSGADVPAAHSVAFLDKADFLFLSFGALRESVLGGVGDRLTVRVYEEVSAQDQQWTLGYRASQAPMWVGVPEAPMYVPWGGRPTRLTVEFAPVAGYSPTELVIEYALVAYQSGG